MKTVRSLLMGFFLTLIVVGVVYSVYTAGRAVCCEVDLDVFQTQLTTATALNIGISTLLSRIKYRARLALVPDLHRPDGRRFRSLDDQLLDGPRHGSREPGGRVDGLSH